MNKPVLIEGSVDDVRGFTSLGVHAGLKRAKPDMALIVSDVEATAAAVYTKNAIKAAPLLVTKKNLAHSGGKARVVVVNAGCANACTGAKGMQDAEAMAGMTAAAIGVDPSQVIVASTGVIGQPLPMEKIGKGIGALTLAFRSGAKPAKAEDAILTTDTTTKHVLVESSWKGKKFRIGGIAKGSGMIHPNMGTMLGFLATDAAVAPELLRSLLLEATEASFNMVSVDGDTSTNDMATVMANGASGVEVTAGASETVFAEALGLACVTLAKKIARDGEGANALIEVTVKGASTEKDARKAALAVAGSNLVKAAVFGKDPNWGRIIAAVGYSGAKVKPEKVALYMENGVGRVKIANNGAGIPADQSLLKKILMSDEVKIEVDLGSGRSSARAWGCDLSYDYVKINAKYTT
ncbi:MAG: bifunctional glutamate N-acetyltransferase/amino-acid acetyltransferase ArgJ [Euryarchaeota archaeon]|nr:bifunctional glutamate N-acetyltransferase/amino-acid acetyltransferase ArgJ [Euryarchaeota archaeon]